jgi:hypothetical protein
MLSPHPFESLRSMATRMSMSFVHMSTPVTAPPKMLPALQLPAAETLESHVLIPPLIESIALVQTAGLHPVPGTAAFHVRAIGSVEIFSCLRCTRRHKFYTRCRVVVR